MSDSSDLKLYSYWRSSASWRIRIALNLKKLSYQIHPINLLQGQQLGKEYSDINPNNLLPALKVNDTILVQSPAILEYLEEIYPSQLLPNDPLDKAIVRGLMNVIVCDIHPIQNLRVLKQIQNISSLESAKEEWALYFIRLGFLGLEEMLKKTAGKYCFKDQISFADICLVPQVYNAIRFKVDLQEFPIISRIYKELSELEAFKQAHPEMQPDAPLIDSASELNVSEKDSVMINLLKDLDLEEVVDSGTEVNDMCHLKLDFISLLPTELAIQILKYVNSIQMFKFIPLVSTRWHRISRDNDVWRCLFLQRWGRPKNHLAFVEKDWKALYRSRMDLNCNWSKGNVSGTCLSGHLDSVYCIQYDDSILLSGSRDQTIKFWSLETKECIRTLTGHTGSVLCLEYNSKYIITGSSDSTIIIWDFETGLILNRLSGHSLPVLDVRFDGDIIASCSKDSLIKIWDLQTGTLKRTLQGHKAAVNAIHLFNGLLTSASGDCSIRLWDISTGNLVREFLGHSRGLACVQHSDEYVASGSNDRTIRIWDIKTGECIRVLEGHKDLVRTLYFDRERLVSGSYDQSIKAWSMTTGSLLWDIPDAHTSWVFHIQMDPSKIVSASQDRQIMIWDLSQNISNLCDIL